MPALRREGAVLCGGMDAGAGGAGGVERRRGGSAADETDAVPVQPGQALLQQVRPLSLRLIGLEGRHPAF